MQAMPTRIFLVLFVHTLICALICTLICPSSVFAFRIESHLETKKKSPATPELHKPVAVWSEAATALPGSLAASERRTALVIGNSAYSTGPLKNPVNDAADMAAMLRKLGFTVTLKRNATLQEMDEAVESFGNRLKRGGVGLFYFAGHGVQINGTNYLLPVGAKINKEVDVKYQAIDANKILDEMAAANNGLNIVVLDACRDNPFSRSFRSASRGLAIVSSAPSGTLISYSTSPGTIARDGDGRNSPYTAALLKYIQEPGVTIGDVFINVRSKLKGETGQVPWELSSLEGKFYFVPVPAKTAIDKSTTQEASGKQIQKEYGEREPANVMSSETSPFDDLKRKMEERREKESRWVKDFEDAKKMEEESSSMPEKIMVWRQFMATLPAERTAKGDEIRQYASTRIDKLEWLQAMGRTMPREIKNDGRFIAYDDGTVLDTAMNLIWAAKDNGSYVNWHGAKSYCEHYRGGGYTDWRLPSQNELAGLYDAAKTYKSACGFDAHLTESIRLSCNALWASDVDGSWAANFSFNNGGRGRNRLTSVHDNFRVLPVRSVK